MELPDRIIAGRAVSLCHPPASSRSATKRRSGSAFTAARNRRARLGWLERSERSHAQGTVGSPFGGDLRRAVGDRPDRRLRSLPPR
jgi:hypothetical protein